MAALTIVDIVRPPIGSFTPSMWGDTFTSFSFDHQVEQKNGKAIEALKEEVRSMLIRAKLKTTADKLILIDTLERLGVGYHFDQEIEVQLQEIFKTYSDDKNNNSEEKEDHDLFITSLQFRLLRQHRHYISSSVFDKFIGKDTKLNEHLRDDAKGLLSLYEAAHLRVHGEAILDEAVAFTKHHLERMLHQRLLESSPLQDQVKRALVHPLHRGNPIIFTHDYISFYEKDKLVDDQLLKLAKLNFNQMQNMYKKEICEVSRWWNELKSPLPYVRDRVVEAYLWGITSILEPQYAYARKTVAKTIQILTVLDDTYDTYATVEEADIFTQSLRRWNIDEIHQLPDYMKIIYRIILSVYKDYERDAAKQGKLYAAPCAKETVIQVCEAYNKEIKWARRQELPSFEEYIENSVIASCLFAISSTTFPSIKSITIENINWLMSVPKIAVAAAKVCRYLDDVGGYSRESMDGKYLTGVDIYMKQHGMSMEETKYKFMELTEDEWKDLNKEWMNINSVPKDMLQQVLGYARSSEVFYRSSEDGYAKTGALAPYIRALFIDPITI